MRVLVLGATGVLGEPVARRFCECGYHVRVLTRDRTRALSRFADPIEVMQGDALQYDDLQRVMAGCDAVHISIDHEREAECVRQVIAAGQAVRLTRLTYVSGTTVCAENRWFPLIDRKLECEDLVRRSGIPWTIFCPGWFMEMLGRFVRNGKAYLFNHPRRTWHFLAAEEFARMVVESYRHPEALGQRFHLHGPEALTIDEALQRYCRGVHPEIQRIHRWPNWVFRVLAWLQGSTELRDAVKLLDYCERVGESGDPGRANTLLGTPTLTLDEWIRRKRSV